MALGLIRDAFRKGVRLFNHRNSRGCADVYYKTMETIVQMQNVPSEVQERLQEAMKEADIMTAQSKRAWTLRYGLDDAREKIFMMQDQHN